jgi:hypothetical protein
VPAQTGHRQRQGRARRLPTRPTRAYLQPSSAPAPGHTASETARSCGSASPQQRGEGWRHSPLSTPIPTLPPHSSPVKSCRRQARSMRPQLQQLPIAARRQAELRDGPPLLLIGGKADQRELVRPLTCSPSSPVVSLPMHAPVPVRRREQAGAATKTHSTRRIARAPTSSPLHKSPGHPLARAQSSTAVWPLLAVIIPTIQSHGQPLARAHCRTARCPPAKLCTALHVLLVQRASQSFAQAYCRTARSPPWAAL